MVDPVNSSGPAQAAPIVRNANPKLALPAAGEPTPSDLPGLFNMAAKIASEGPPVDYAKLAQIRTAIFRGNYPIDTNAVANAMSFQAFL